MAFGTIFDTVQTKCDVVYMHTNEEENIPNAIKNKYIYHEQYTLVNDLLLDEETIFEGFNKNYKNEIRRAMKEGVKCSIVLGSSSLVNKEVDCFERVYNKMFASKGLSNKFNRRLVLSGLNKKQIIITKSIFEGKECIVYHAYLADGNKTMLMYSASTLSEAGNKEYSNLIGWMNKYLHWFDMVWFKNNGYSKYEWGGINSIDEPNGIARFKMGFNGTKKRYLNYLTATSLFGRIYLLLVKKRGREWKQ